MSQSPAEMPLPEAEQKTKTARTAAGKSAASQPASPETVALASPGLESDPHATRAWVDAPHGLQSGAVGFPAISGYQIDGILGRGGMGVVFKARHLALNRPVALKVIRAGHGADPLEVSRFKSEAQAAARLHHPNIVQIFEVGEHAGLPFCALEFVDGGSLAERLSERLPTPLEAAGLTEILAQAMHFAHCRNIIHRDLKPANILLTADNIPKVTDFGLARQLDVDSGQTLAGVVMGTPSFMAPEQASGQAHAAGPAADTYALGAILYTLLTGQPPFQGATALETLDQVRTRAPAPPSGLQPQLPRDLETICLKCLNKEPERRYASAQELAEDLRRFQNGEPIRARPVSTGERLWRWAGRNPTVAALIVLANVIGLLGFAGILWQWHAAVVAVEAEASAKRQTELTLADMYTSFGVAADSTNRPAQAVLWFAQAAKRAGNDEHRENANRIRFTTWERQTYQPVAAMKGPGEWFNQLAFHPTPHDTLGARYLLTESGQTTAVFGRWSLWDLATETEIPFPSEYDVPTAAAWNVDGSLLALGNVKGEVFLVEFKSLHPATPWGKLQKRLPSITGSVCVLSFSPNGKLLAIGSSKTARVWDVDHAAFATPELAPRQHVSMLTFNSLGTRLVVASQDHKARLYAVPSDSPDCVWGLDKAVPHVRLGNNRAQRLVPLLFLNDDRDLLTYTQPLKSVYQLTWIDAATGLAKERTLPLANYLTCIATDKDGKRLAVSSSTWRLQEGENNVQIVAAASDGEAAESFQLPQRLRTFMLSMTFSVDKKSLLTACSDGTVQMWSIPAGKPIGPALLHPTLVELAAFSADSQWIATAQRGGLLRVWKSPRTGLDLIRLAHEPGGSLAQLSPDEKQVLPTGTTFHTCSLVRPRVFDLESGKPAGPALGNDQDGIVVDAAFSPDGAQVILARSAATRPTDRGLQSIPKGTIEFWHWRTGQPSRPSLQTEAEPRSLNFSPKDPHLLAVLGANGQLLILDSAGAIKQQTKAHPANPGVGSFLNNGKVRFSPDGQSVLTWGTDHEVRIWDIDNLELRCKLTSPAKGLFTDLHFSPDHRHLLVAARDNVVRIWDWNQGRPDAAPARAVLKHPDWPHVAQFSPDGKSVLTGCRDKHSRLWDWQEGKLLWSVTQDHEVHAVAFNQSGDQVLTMCDDKTLRVWDARTGFPLTPALPVSGEGGSLTVTKNGKHAVAGGFGSSIDVFRLDGLRANKTRDIAELCRWGEILSGQTVHEGGATTQLTAEEWYNAWREFRHR